MWKRGAKAATPPKLNSKGNYTYHALLTLHALQVVCDVNLIQFGCSPWYLGRWMVRLLRWISRLEKLDRLGNWIVDYLYDIVLHVEVLICH